MKANILENHGPLCSLYKAHVKGDKGFSEGDFRSEGDSPAFSTRSRTACAAMNRPTGAAGAGVSSRSARTPGSIRC